LSIALSLE